MILKTQKEKIDMYEEILKLKQDNNMKCKLRYLEDVYNITADLSSVYNIMFFYLFTEKQIESVCDLVVNYISNIMDETERYRMIPKDGPTEMNIIITEFDQESLYVSFTVSIVYKAYDKKTRSYSYIMSDPILSLRLHIEAEDNSDNKDFEYVDGKYVENKEDTVNKLESIEDPLIGKSVSEAVTIANNTVKENVMSLDKYVKIRKSVKERIASKLKYFDRHEEEINGDIIRNIYALIDHKDRETIIIISRLSNKEFESLIEWSIYRYAIFKNLFRKLARISLYRINNVSCRNKFMIRLNTTEGERELLYNVDDKTIVE